MGLCALQDLNMAGVVWELSENATALATKKAPTQQTFNDAMTKNTTRPVIIPPAAPISLETVKSMVVRPNDIDSLVRMVMEFNHPLRGGAQHVVMPNIAQNPNGLVIITDMPRSEDDASGKILSFIRGPISRDLLLFVGLILTLLCTIL